MKILITSLLLFLATLNQTAKLDSQTKVIEYHIKLSIELGSTEEKIKTYTENDTLFADVNFIQYTESPGQSNKLSTRNYIDSFFIKRVALSKAQIDSIEAFNEMIITGNIRHNQGIKIAGSTGKYKASEQNIEIKSRNLYSLIAAINLEK